MSQGNVPQDAFALDQEQQKNLFDLCVGIAVLIVVVLTLTLSKNNIPQQTHKQIFFNRYIGFDFVDHP